MSFDADSLAERRRIKRRLSWWRIIAIVAIVAALAAITAGGKEGYGSKLFPTPQIARVSIEGFISDNRKQRELLTKVADADNVKGVILFINSPGGTTSGGEALYNALRRLAEKKPTVALFGTSATSAAYLSGIAADHIVARGNSITGSVGVILQWAEFSELAKNLGIHVEEVRSGPLKAVPSLLSPTDGEGKKIVEDLVNESRDWFVQIVKQRRKLSDEVLAEVKTGRVYTGRQALPLGLVDEIGDEETAHIWLKEKRGVSKDLSVVDWKAEDGTSWFSLRGMAESAGAFVGALFGRVGESLVKSYYLNNLDGLTSVWQPHEQQ